MKKQDEIKQNADGLKYFSSLPSLIQNQVVENGITINSKPAMERFYHDILNSGHMVSGMDEDI